VATGGAGTAEVECLQHLVEADRFDDLQDLLLELEVGLGACLGFDKETRPSYLDDPHPDRVACIGLRPECTRSPVLPAIEEPRFASKIPFLADDENQACGWAAPQG
jgi:hypothetical protein